VPGGALGSPNQKSAVLCFLAQRGIAALECTHISLQLKELKLKLQKPLLMMRASLILEMGVAKTEVLGLCKRHWQ